MKIFVQIIDTKTGIYQTRMIDESVKEGNEIANAIKHFGPSYGEITWNDDFINQEVVNNPRILTGYIEGTSKIVNIVVIYESVPENLGFNPIGI